MLETSENTLTIGTITTDDRGRYTWEANGQTYWTNALGQGLFTSTYSEHTDHQGNVRVSGEHNKQIAGTAQFAIGHLTPAGRRQHVIAYFVRRCPGYREWLSSRNLSDTLASAKEFYSLHQPSPPNTGMKLARPLS